MQPLAELDDEQFEVARRIVYRETGNRVGDGKRTLLGNRLRRRMRALGYDTLGDYLHFLASPRGRGELPNFVDAVTTNETSFFRTPEHFEWFGGEFLHDVSLAARRSERPPRLRVWSAACSTGEEPYSLAICLLENGLKLREWDLGILATDVSGDVLERARRGAYPQTAVESLEERRRKRYFVDRDDAWHIAPKAAALVEFRRHNLLAGPPPDTFDCVFLRNVLIYFDADSKRRVVHGIVRALAPNGYLVLGPSEGVADLLGGLDKQRPWLYRKTEELR